MVMSGINEGSWLTVDGPPDGSMALKELIRDQSANGVNVKMDSVASYSSWFDDNKYAKYYRFLVKATF